MIGMKIRQLFGEIMFFISAHIYFCYRTSLAITHYLIKNPVLTGRLHCKSTNIHPVKFMSSNLRKIASWKVKNLYSIAVA